MPELQPFPVHTDERGELIPLELDQVPFAVRRVFWVRGSAAALERGEHTADCRQLVVLLSGTAEITYGVPGRLVHDTLVDPGQHVLVDADHHVVYRLADERASILVLASEPFASRER